MTLDFCVDVLTVVLVIMVIALQVQIIKLNKKVAALEGQATQP